MAATVWKGYLSFGLVSFPVRLAAAARREPVRFHMLHRKDHSRIKEVFYCATEDKPIDRAEIVKGYQVAKDNYIVGSPSTPCITPMNCTKPPTLRALRRVPTLGRKWNWPRN